MESDLFIVIVMKKLIDGIILGLLCLIISFSTVAAQIGDWQGYGDNPRQILNNVAGDVSSETRIQDTELNRVSREE